MSLNSSTLQDILRDAEAARITRRNSNEHKQRESVVISQEIPSININSSVEGDSSLTMNQNSTDINTPYVPTSHVSIDTSDEKVSLGDRMKGYEKTDSVPPYQAFVIRADGHCFSKYTAQLPKPFDDGFCRAMVKTANGVMTEFNAKTVFVCSDEITAVFSPVCTKEEYETLVQNGEKNLPTHIFSGRHNKIETLFASKCTALFNKYMLAEATNPSSLPYTFIMLTKIHACEATFDSRMIPIPVGSEIEIVNNIIWRSCYDCYRNATSSYARHKLGHKACMNKNSNEMISLMMDKGFDYTTEVPLWYKYGVLCKKVMVHMINEKGEEFVRSKNYNFCTNLVQQDREKTLRLFFAKYYEDLITQQEYFAIIA